ncbi:MAG: mandelate racemase/muconate lactonizing enzyme family protein [Chloroflexi bacterium]|nr:mandelate racemase/muconate lactonizing enzyme family protein [Chloroflexota bacterium]
MTEPLTANYDPSQYVRTWSAPSELRITDIRISHVTGAPMRCPLIKIITNQGVEGYGEVRDAASPQYAAMLRRHLIGENPCAVDRIFRRIKQFGGPARQGGGVSGIEVALWDLAGKAYGVPCYQLLGGKFRDSIRIYCDTDADGKPDGLAMGTALKKRMERGFTFLKMDLGVNQIASIPGALSAPLGYLDKLAALAQAVQEAPDEAARRVARRRQYDAYNVQHPFTGLHLTEKGLQCLEEYVAQVRSVIGDEVPLAVDHLGHIALEDAIALARRVEKYHLAWLEDAIPWQYTEQYMRLARATTVPICTGEDIYLKEGFRPLLEAGAVAVIHPDILTAGGMLETKKIADLAQEYGVALAMHMAESPIACLAAVHTSAACENFYVLENHSVDVPWWDDLVCGTAKPLVQQGFIRVPEKPGLGIEALNDEVIARHMDPQGPGLWASTEYWENDISHDRLWS